MTALVAIEAVALQAKCQPALVGLETAKASGARVGWQAEKRGAAMRARSLKVSTGNEKEKR